MDTEMCVETAALPETSPRRDEYLDSLKGILIFLVVVGHLPTRFLDVFCPFHMPLFVMIRGYLTHRMSAGKLAGSILKLLQPLIILTVLQWVVYGFPGELQRWFRPPFAMWYLLCLIYWRVLAYFWQGRCRTVWLPVFCALSLAVGYIPVGGFLCFQRLFTFLPFFYMGCLIRERGWMHALRARGGWLGLGVLAVLFALFFVTRDFGLDVRMWEGAKPYSSSAYHTPILGRAICLFTGMATCLLILMNPVRHRILAWVGRYSLYVYLFHIFFVLGLWEPLKGFPWWGSFMNAGIAAVIVLVCAAFGTTRLAKWITTPFPCKR